MYRLDNIYILKIFSRIHLITINYMTTKQYYIFIWNSDKEKKKIIIFFLETTKVNNILRINLLKCALAMNEAF